MQQRLWFTLLIVVLMSTLAAPALAEGPTDGRTGRAEVRFLEGMIDHHQMALDMAADCLNKAVTESVKTLCQGVIDAQSAEIALMQGWLKDWYGIDYSPMSMLGTTPAATASSMEGMDMSNSDNMGGMDMGDSDDMSGMNMMGMMGMMMNMKMGDMMSMMQGMPGMENMTMMDMMGMMMNMMMNMKMGDMMSMMQGMPGMENMTMMDMMGMMMQQGMMEQPSDSSTEHQGHNQDQPAQEGDHSQHHPAQGGNDPVMMMGMMAGLNSLEGVEYEIAWLEAMIDHHGDALHMSERILLFKDIHPELAELAENIIAAQNAEISTMEQLITELSGS